MTRLLISFVESLISGDKSVGSRGIDRRMVLLSNAAGVTREFAVGALSMGFES